MSIDEHLPPKERLISLAECILGALLVIGHNVYRILPNEVYTLLALGLVSLYVRNGGFKALRGVGLRAPSSWGWIVLAGVVTAVLMQLDDVVTDPLGRLFTQQPQHISSVMPRAHDLRKSLSALALIWTFAAFGEEFGYRAYLMTRFGEMAGGRWIGKTIALLAVSVLFGFGHFYKGPAGIVDSTASGLLLGAAYLVTGSLWAPILAHGLSDTFAVVVLYFGWFGTSN